MGETVKTMTNVFFISYGGPANNGNVYTPYKMVAHSADEAIAVINTWKAYGRKQSGPSITVNEKTEQKLRDLFRDGLGTYYDGKPCTYASMRTTGCGAWNITVEPALADTLEEHIRIFNERREAARQERMKQEEIARQKRLEALNEQRRGWYHVELELNVYVFATRGNDYRDQPVYSCTMIADSGMDAYDKVVKYVQDNPGEIEVRGNWTALESWADPASSGFKFEFLGVKTDDGYSVKLWEDWKERGDI